MAPEATIAQTDPKAEAALAAAEFAQFPLQSLRLTFGTTDDDKDGDTAVAVSIDNNSVLMGSGTVGGGQHWDDNSSAVVGIPVANGVDYYSAAAGNLNITIFPNGDDEWHFNVELYMEFAGGGWRRVSWNGINLAEDRRSINLRWA